MFSTYFGGFAVNAQGSTFDSAGNGYLVGMSSTGDLPTAGNPAQMNMAGGGDAFVAKLSADGRTLLYSTYLGGSAFDISGSVAVDAAQNVFVYGVTGSKDFPVKNAYQDTLFGGLNAFVTELDPSGAIVYSTYLGGSGTDIGYFIGVDRNDSVYLDGLTTSTDFPVTPSTAYQSTNPSGGQVTESFVTRLDPPLALGNVRLGYSTYFGGPLAPGGAGASLIGDCVGGKPGIVYVTGFAGNRVPVTTGKSYQGAGDAIVAEFDTTKSKNASLVYSTYLGGSGNDTATMIGIAPGCVSNCAAYVSGFTYSPDFPVTSGAAQTKIGGDADAFVAELDGTGHLKYATFVGGTGFDLGNRHRSGCGGRRLHGRSDF